MNYQTIRLDKSLYKAEGGFLSQLEQLDPSSNYKGTELASLDAFERQLKRFGIKVNGASSDVVAKFFSTSDSAALFPEYVARAVAKGSEDETILREIIASTTQINALDYRSISTQLEPFLDSTIAEGTPIPEVSISLSDSLIHLKKRGRLLSASYEAIKHQRVDVITVALRKIGQSLAKAQLQDAVNFLFEGEGSVPPAEIIPANGSLSYSHLLDFWSAFAEFDLNVMLASPATTRRLLEIPEFSDHNTGNTFLTTGALITPFGAKLLRSSAVPDDYVIGLDKHYALEFVTTGNVQVEYDKLIDTQLERAAISSTYGFSKLFPDATKLLKLQ